MFHLIIAGGRDFDDYALLARTVDEFLSDRQDEVTVFCGKAQGADSLGARYAAERGYAIAYFPADWRRYGRRAGPVRNRKMAEQADALVAFWDGSSRGTENMIENASRLHLKILVQDYKKEEREPG